MARPIKTLFTPQHPEKYVGTYPIVSRRRWETEFMNVCDQRDQVLEWSSEGQQIPYHDPLTGRQKVYVPDFLVVMIDRDTKQVIKKLIEVKPMHEQLTEFARNTQDAAIQARNRAKWGAAIAWCMRRGITFEVMNERQMFHGANLMKPRVNPVAEYAPGLTKKKKVAKPKSRLAAIKKRQTKKATSRFARVGKVKKV
jgi:hypothetical protein